MDAKELREACLDYLANLPEGLTAGFTDIMADHFGEKITRVRRVLNKLTEEGLVKKGGTKAWRCWNLAE